MPRGAVRETLINEYARRKFITGFTLRFLTIPVRAGSELLDGKKCVILIGDRDSKSWLCLPKTFVQNLLLILRLPANSVLVHNQCSGDVRDGARNNGCLKEGSWQG
jgi:hypothetical protein